MDKKGLAGDTGHHDRRDEKFGKSAHETLSEGNSFFLYPLQNTNDRRWLTLISDNLGFR